MRKLSIPPLVFVYSGGLLPNYAEASISLSLRFNQLPHVLISDALRPRWLSGEVEFIDSRQFGQLSADSLVGSEFPYPHDFRNGFWLRTIDRFRLLDEWAQASEHAKYIHSELDNLSLGLEDSLGGFHKLSRFAVPRESKEQAVASLVFVDSSSGSPFKDLLDFIKSNSGLGNEMELLAAYLDASPAVDASALPTIAGFQTSENPSSSTQLPWRTLSASDFGGIFDAASIGRWLLGVDPRNRGGKPVRNLELHPRTEGEPQALRYMFSNGRLSVENINSAEITRLFNVHVHSKVFHRVTSTRFMNRLVNGVNQNRPVLIVPATRQWVTSEIIRWLRYLSSRAFLSNVVAAVRKKLDFHMDR